MDFARPSEGALLAMAKTQLGLPLYGSDVNVPRAYLDELKHHVSIYPDDTNFRAELQPGTGLGVVVCLEAGCGGVVVNLTPRIRVPDGGKKDGIGSLTAYRIHIVDHPTHKSARLVRIKARTAPNNQDACVIAPAPRMGMIERPKRPSLLSQLDASFGSYSSSSSSSSQPRDQTRIVSSPESIKPEPTEHIIPRKRPSDSGLSSAGVKVEGFPMDFLGGSSSGPESFKKIKFEQKVPLASLNSNTASSSQQPSAVGLSLTAATAQLEDVEQRLTKTIDEFNDLARKPRKTKADLTRFGVLNKHIDRLVAKKNDCKAVITSLTHVAPNPPKREPPPFLFPAPDPFDFSRVQPPVQPPFAIQQPIIHQPQPVASGSNIRLPDAMAYRDMEVDDGLSSDPDIPDHLRATLQPGVIGGYGEGFDTDGNFHGRGRDTFAGPQANADDIDKFLIAAGNAEQFDGNARVDQALEKLGLYKQYQLLHGMSVALMPHQTIGVAWMLDKEKGNHGLQGGILADEMGLGKTVQTIAIMVHNVSDDPAVKTNLIVGPMALLDQWKLEIETKTNIGFSCHIYHGPGKAKKKKDLLKHDVVLTTYMTLALEWPDLEAEEKAAKKKAQKKKAQNFIETDSEDESNRKKPRERGLLFQVKWHRVILDESQNIRNRRTRIARCVTDLQAMYRWCLTGTPITNTIVDAYSPLRFLKIRPWYDWSYFNHHIAKFEKKNPTLATNKLQAIFATTLLRRKKDSVLDGKRLIELPEKTVDLLKLEFSEEERAIYKMIEARTQATFNRFLRAGTVLKNYHQVLVLLLRLRQICSHPALIQEGSAALVRPDEEDEFSTPEIHEELFRARDLVGQEFVDKMKQKLMEITLRRMEAEKESVDAVAEPEECPICMDVFTDAVVTPCTHSFCRECLTNVLNGPEHVQDVNEPIKYKNNEKPCPSCRSPISQDKIFSRQAFEPTDAELPGDDLAGIKPEGLDDEDMPKIIEDTAKGKGKARKRSARRIVDSEDDTEGELDSDMEDFIVQSDEDESEKDARRTERKRLGKKKAVVIDSEDEVESGGEDNEVIYGKKATPPISQEEIKMLPRFLPSTKMKRMMESLTIWAKENPEEKTLIISQWTQCLQLVSDYLTENDFLHVKYQGDMNRQKRDQAVRVFMAKDKASIMLMSLKCGGVGLNLTRANRVISIDLGWSEAVESQAFDRVHRLGQQRPVFVQRLVIADTVEDRVLALQERKKNIADGSLGEGTGKKIGRLSVRELANLFGLDARGRLLAPA